MSRVQDIGSKPDLLALTDDLPYVRWDTDPRVEAKGVRTPAGWAAAFVRPTHAHGTAMNLVASCDELAVEVMTDPATNGWLDRTGCTGVTIQTERAAAVVAALGGDLRDFVQWEWMVTTEVPPAPRAHVVDLPEVHAAEITDFIMRENPRTDGRPFAWPGQRWLGVRDAAGELLAAGCRAHTGAGHPLLTGIVVRADARGQGLGRELTGALTRLGLSEAPVCTLELYSDNAVARHLYTDLGYGQTAAWTSGARP